MYTVLLIDTWLYYSKSLNCCIEFRGLLGCSADPSQPCLGFTDNCAALREQFDGVPGLGVPDDYHCRQARERLSHSRPRADECHRRTLYFQDTRAT